MIATFAETVKSTFEQARIAEVSLDFDMAVRSADMLNQIVKKYHIGTAEIKECGVVVHSTNAFICSSAVCQNGSVLNPIHTFIAFAVRLGDNLESVGT